MLKEGTKVQLLNELDETAGGFVSEQEVLEMQWSKQKFPRRPVHPGSVEVAELFADCANASMRANLFNLAAIEIEGIEFGSFDYRRKTDRGIVFQSLWKHHVKAVLVGIRCTPWQAYNYTIYYRDRPEGREAPQSKDVCFLSFIEYVFNEQVTREAVLELPNDRQVSKHKVYLRIKDRKINGMHVITKVVSPCA